MFETLYTLEEDEDVEDFVAINLYHEIHVSERMAFKGCRRRWNWAFNEQYYPKVVAKPLEFGSAFHAALEVWYDPDNQDELAGNRLHMAQKAFKDMAEAQRKEALAKTGSNFLDPLIEEDYNDRVELGLGMLEWYAENIAPSHDVGWTPLHTEVKFATALKHPQGDENSIIVCRCTKCIHKYNVAFELCQLPTWWVHHVGPGLPVCVEGRVDMVAKDKDGYLWIWDHKTRASLPEQDEYLLLDDQITTYIWALRQIGLDIKGFVYNEIRKGFPEPPKKNKTRRLGCLFSVSKSQTTSYDLFLETVSKEDREAWEAGCYDDFLTYLLHDGILFHKRTPIMKTEAELANYERDLGDEVLEMIRPDLPLYPAPGRFNCSWCAFKTPCIEKNNGGDYQYALDTMYDVLSPYYVRQEKGPSTESFGGE